MLGPSEVVVHSSVEQWGDDSFFELRFRPSVQLVSVVRRFVAEFYRRLLIDDELTDRLAVATHEMLENSVKYSSDGETRIRIDLSIEPPRDVTITIQNRASQAHIAALRDAVDSMHDAPSPFVFYQAKMAESARRLTGSGLGLARVRAECAMEVDYRIEGELVSLKAKAKVEGEVMR
jgi:anti-sigma regulatory factor (Ser/Thr protein kinase)